MSHRVPSYLVVALAGAFSLAGCGAGGGGGGGERLSITAPSIITPSLPDATVGVAYHAPLAASGGRDPLDWRVAAGGALPGGIDLSTTRGRQIALDGTPGAAGGHAFTIEVSDSTGAATQRAFTLDVFDPLAITTATLTAAESYDPYSAVIQASGGKAPFAWSIAGGALPAGLALSASTASSVSLQGVTAARGTFTFTLAVADAGGRSAQRQLTLRVDDIERYVFGGKLEVFGVEQVILTERVNGAPATPRILIENTVGRGAPYGQVLLATSPDGRYLATIMDRAVPTAYDLYVVDLKGPSAGRIRLVNEGLAGTAGLEVKRLFWSPDSRRIGFVGDIATAGVLDVFVADVTVPSTIAPVNVTRYGAGQGVSFWDIAFTNDSRHLVFIGDTDPDPTQNPSGMKNELFFADLAAATPAAIRLSKPLSSPADMDVETFTVAAAGRGIAYRGDLEQDGIQDVYHVTLAQGATGATARVTNAATARDFVGGPWISPDGARLLFTSWTSSSLAIDPTFSSYIPGPLPYVVDLRAASPAPVTLGAATDGAIQKPIWSPDGAKVLLYRQPDDGTGYVAFAGGELQLVDAASGASTRINATLWDGTVDASFSFGGIDTYAYDFSPDGSALYYKQQTAAPGPSFGWGPPPARHDVFRVDLGGASPAAPVQATPVIAGLTDGGADGQVRFSADSSKLSIVFRNNATGGMIDTYVVHDVVQGNITIAGTTVQGRLNNNAPGPKWTAGDRGLVISGPFEASSVAYNELYFLDLSGGVQKLTPATVRQDADISDFYAED